MAITAFSDLVPRLEQWLTDVPDGVALQALQQGTINFVQDTNAWEVVCAPMPIVGYQQDYSLVYTPTSATVQAIVGLTLYGNPLLSQCYSLVDPATLRFAYTQIPTATDTFTAYDTTSTTYSVGDQVTYGSGATYQVYRAKVNIAAPAGAFVAANWRIDFAAGIRVTAAMLPDISANGTDFVPLLNRHSQGLLAAARMILLRQQGKPWTPVVPRRGRGVPPAMQEAQEDYYKAVRQAKANRLTGGDASLLTMTTPRW